MDYGVIGFNGDTKISASTTHLYVFVSYIFNLIFGKENFIEPLFIFNSVLFTIGTLFFHICFLKILGIKLFYFFTRNFTPSIKISILGMEYGILFFLKWPCCIMASIKGKKWVLTFFRPNFVYQN
jgi:hypothetical protein